MSTHDYIIDNAVGATVRADINSALEAIATNNSSSTEPATMYAYQWWADTTSGLLKQRNSTNTAWVTQGSLAGLGTNVATFLATPSSANLAAALTDETGSGAAVFGTSPTITTPAVVSQTISGTAGNLYSSNYTPTITNGTNISSTTAYAQSFYTRVGDYVMFNITLQITPTATGAFDLQISLPVASNFTGARQATGVAIATGSTTMQSAILIPDTTNDTLAMSGIATETTARNWQVAGRYQIL